MERELQKKPYLKAVLNVTCIELGDVITTSGELIEESPGASTPGDGWT